MYLYRILFASLLIILPQYVYAGIDTYYVTQNGAGLKNGSSIENAWSLDHFNNASYWSQTDNPSLIDPGDSVQLSGTFTKNFVPKGSGTSTNPIIIDGTNAKIVTSIKDYSKIFNIINIEHLILKNLSINGQDSMMNSPGGAEASAIRIRELGKPTGHITIQDSDIQASGSAITIQGDVSHINVYRNRISSMSNNGVAVVADNYDGDGKDNCDDCPSYIVVGGTQGNGNTFANIGKLTPEEWVNYDAGYKGGAVPGYTLGTMAKDLIFSHNHIYSNLTDVGSGIYMNGAKRILIENNVIHSLDSDSHRSYITFKNDDPLYTEDIVIRFNKIYDVYDGPNQYAPPGDAIRISGEGRNRVIHGNYCEGAGINLNWNWSADNEGIGGDGYYVWGNVVNGTASGGGISINGTSLNKDTFKNFYIYNNTIYRAVKNHDSGAYFYGINTSFGGTASTLKNVNVKNNVVIDSRPNGTEYINISMSFLSDMKIDYNHHYSSGHTPMVYYDGTQCTPCPWNSPNLPSGYGVHDTAGNPIFSSAGNGNFALLAGSPCIDSGENLSINDSALPTITIQGRKYSFTFSEVLDPLNTDWSLIQPKVATVNQNVFGSWDRGAYVYSNVSEIKPPSNLKIGN